MSSRALYANQRTKRQGPARTTSAIRITKGALILQKKKIGIMLYVWETADTYAHFGSGVPQSAQNLLAGCFNRCSNLSLALARSTSVKSCMLLYAGCSYCRKHANH